MIKSIDIKIAELGFKCIYANNRILQYRRHVIITKGSVEYDQCVEITYKANGNHQISSYKCDVNMEGYDTYVSLSIYETKLFLKKAIQMGFKPLSKKKAVELWDQKNS